MGLTYGGQFGQNCQKLHEHYKINFFLGGGQNGRGGNGRGGMGGSSQFLGQWDVPPVPPTLGETL